MSDSITAERLFAEFRQKYPLDLIRQRTNEVSFPTTEVTHCETIECSNGYLAFDKLAWCIWERKNLRPDSKPDQIIIISNRAYVSFVQREMSDDDFTTLRKKHQELQIFYTTLKEELEYIDVYTYMDNPFSSQPSADPEYKEATEALGAKIDALRAVILPDEEFWLAKLTNTESANLTDEHATEL